MPSSEPTVPGEAPPSEDPDGAARHPRSGHDDAAERIPTGFFFECLSDEFRRAVVHSALRGRKSARPATRDRLNARLKPLPVAGFRDASKARPSHLLEPVLNAIRSGDDRLATAVLTSWSEAHEPVRNAATEVLAGAAIPVEPDFASLQLAPAWPFDDWYAMRDLVIERHPDASPEAAGLMLAVLAGRVPVQEPDPVDLLLTPRFLRWFGELDALPCEAPEWEEAIEFAASVVGLAAVRLQQRQSAAVAARDEALRRLVEEYAAEIEYLGIDLGTWSDPGGPPPAATLALAEELSAALGLYGPIRPQGSSRDEEAARAPRRARQETAILELVAHWKTLPRLDDDEIPPPAPEPMPPAETADLERERREAELDRLETARANAAAERDRLRAVNDTLRLAKDQLDRETSDLKGELSQARSTEEHWRLAYVAARRAGVSSDRADIPVGSVREAIELAERAFPEALDFGLNGKSDPDMPFAKPAEVFDALGWLATCYRRRQASSIGESCPGWFYKAAQSESTVGMFPEWYRTSFHGRSYDITAHIGKGNSFDPRSTIRIAFAWDDERERVVVGYVGRHQRNRQS